MNASIDHQIDQLIAAGDALIPALQTLKHARSPEQADRIAIQLGGMYRESHKLVEALATERGDER